MLKAARLLRSMWRSAAAWVLMPTSQTVSLARRTLATTSRLPTAQDAAVITLQSRARVSLSRKLTAERRAFIEAAEAATEAQLDEIDRQAREAEILAASKTRMKRPSLLAALTVETVDSPEPHGVDTLSSPIGAALVNRKAAFQSSVSSPIGAALVNRKAAFQSSVSSPIGAALVNRKAAFQRRAEQPGPDDTAGAVAVKIVRQAIDEVLAEEGSALIDEDAAEAKRVARRAIEAALLAPTSAEPNGPDDAGASTPPTCSHRWSVLTRWSSTRKQMKRKDTGR